jgi:hypothetical protein
MSHWQNGKIDLKCSLNILKKALINVMPAWEAHITTSDIPNLNATFHGKAVDQKYQLVVSKSANLYSDIGFVTNEDGTWEMGGDYSINALKNKLTGEVMRMRALAIAQMRGYEVIRNEINDNEIITEIRVDASKAKELL